MGKGLIDMLTKEVYSEIKVNINRAIYDYKINGILKSKLTGNNVLSLLEVKEFFNLAKFEDFSNLDELKIDGKCWYDELKTNLNAVVDISIDLLDDNMVNNLVINLYKNYEFIAEKSSRLKKYRNIAIAECSYNGEKNKYEYQLKLVELYKSDYDNKHAHLWEIFFKFLYAIALVLGIYTFELDKFLCGTDAKIKMYLLIFVEIVITTLAWIVLAREYYVVKVMNIHFTERLSEIGLERLPEGKVERNFVEKWSIKTGTWMCWSLLLIGYSSAILIYYLQGK